jgi:hypothetical protein
MSRHGSGTGWVPDETPVHAVHAMAGSWRIMFHSNVFFGWDAQNSDQGDGEVEAPNWFMLMASRELAGGELMLRGMFSLDPVTVGKSGYPLLLQTGETFEGEPLVDRQHPHDLFMELAASYTHELGSGLAIQIYGGPAGEPALGPTAFPHRPSAFADPLAPLSHHWQDSTHITFGVLTVGLMTRSVKLEGSWFNGREPDEERFDLDLRGFDSFSGRLTVNPAPSWSLQASYGFLDSPEALTPDVSIHRLTASATHVTRVGENGHWATSLVWGRNDPDDDEATDSVLLESALDLGKLGVTFGRAEYVVKTGHEFAFPEAMEDVRLPIGSFVLGHLHNFDEIASMVPGIGVRGSINVIADDLEPRYGTKLPFGVMVYLRLAPGPMKRHRM